MSLGLSILDELVEVHSPLVRRRLLGKVESDLLQLLELVVSHLGWPSLLPIVVLIPLLLDPPGELLVLFVGLGYAAVTVDFLVGLEILKAFGPAVNDLLCFAGIGLTSSGSTTTSRSTRGLILGTLKVEAVTIMNRNEKSRSFIRGYWSGTETICKWKHHATSKYVHT